MMAIFGPLLVFAGIGIIIYIEHLYGSTKKLKVMYNNKVYNILEKFLIDNPEFEKDYFWTSPDDEITHIAMYIDERGNKILAVFNKISRKFYEFHDEAVRNVRLGKFKNYKFQIVYPENFYIQIHL